MSSLSLKYEKFRKLCYYASPGPWEIDDRDVSVSRVYSSEHRLGSPVCEVRSPIYNAQFIAEAREMVPDLLNDIDRATFEWQRLWDVVMKVREIHKMVPVFVLADECTDHSDEHADAHHFEVDNGEWVCDTEVLEYVCAECSHDRDELISYPCLTIREMDGRV